MGLYPACLAVIDVAQYHFPVASHLGGMPVDHSREYIDTAAHLLRPGTLEDGDRMTVTLRKQSPRADMPGPPLQSWKK